MEELSKQEIGFFLRAGKGTKRFFQVLWLFVRYLFDRTLDALARDVVVVQREADLFLGIALFLIGLLGFESSRYCDGNLNDYISCTRPATYYYFDTLDIVCIVIGTFFVLVWYFKHKERTARPQGKKN